MSDDLIKRAREAAEPEDYGEPDTLITELADRIEAQAAEIVKLREALRTVEQGVPRPVGRSWFPDGRPSKHDQCIHGIWMYEPCEGCTDAFIAAALGEPK